MKVLCVGNKLGLAARASVWRYAVLWTASSVSISKSVAQYRMYASTIGRVVRSRQCCSFVAACVQLVGIVTGMDC